MRTTPFSSDLFQQIHPHHQVIISCSPGCHHWRPAQTTLATEVRELQADVIVECNLDAKYDHYDPVEILDLVDFNANVANLLEDDNIVIVENATTDEYNLSPSISDNFKELESACPEWQPDTQAVHPKWLEHHQSGHLLPSLCRRSRKPCSSLAKERRSTDWSHARRPCIAAFEPSADGSQYCLVAAVTIEGDKESKLLPILVPMPKKDSVSALAALKEAL